MLSATAGAYQQQTCVQKEIRAIYLPDRYGTSVEDGVEFSSSSSAVSLPELEAAVCDPRTYLTLALGV